MMELEVVRGADCWTVRIDGRVDANTTPQLESLMLSVPEEVKTVTLDFTDVSYISSAGLRTLVQVESNLRKQGGSLRIIHAQQMILDIFEVTGFSDFLPVNQ